MKNWMFTELLQQCQMAFWEIVIQGQTENKELSGHLHVANIICQSYQNSKGRSEESWFGCFGRWSGSWSPKLGPITYGRIISSFDRVALHFWLCSVNATSIPYVKDQTLNIKLKFPSTESLIMLIIYSSISLLFSIF